MALASKPDIRMIGASPPLRPNPLRDIESGTVQQLVVHRIGIKRFLLDGSESIGDRLAGLDLIFFIGKHPLNDLTDLVVVVYH
jgi:hypothetical protein